MNVCFVIADRIHRHRARRGQPHQEMRRHDDQAYWTWQYASSPDYFAHFFDLRARLPGADVIDIRVAQQLNELILVRSLLVLHHELEFDLAGRLLAQQPRRFLRGVESGLGISQGGRSPLEYLLKVILARVHLGRADIKRHRV